jgi:hypothetical protein
MYALSLIFLAVYASVWAQSVPAANEPILYETGVGKGEFQDWSLLSNWKHLNGMLVSDGTGPGEGSTLTPAYAPYLPPTADYAIEAEVQTVENTYSGTFGPVIRATTDNKNGYIGLVTRAYNGWTASNICYLQNSECKALGQVYTPDTKWHIYRLEARGNIISFLVDNALLTTLSDNRYLNTGLAGFVTINKEQLQMRNFKVRKLQ